MRLTLAFSPCPNDTFIFDAMVHGRIDTEGLEFDYLFADVEELNRKALNSAVDVTKISYHAYAYVANNYLILDSGSALGYGNGPLLISKKIIVIRIQYCLVKLQFAPEEQKSDSKLLKQRLFRPSRGETIMDNYLYIAISPIQGQFSK